MGEALRLGNIGLYRRYVRLLLRREQLVNDSLVYYVMYLKKFGDDIVSNLQMRNDCIRLKKEIAYVQAVLASGRRIDTAKMDEYLDGQMKHYYRNLTELAVESKEAHKTRIRGKFIRERSDKIFRRIALLIHPDLNPATWNDEELHELWGRVSEAYRDNDVVALLDLEPVVRKTLRNRKFKRGRRGIKNLKVRVSELEEEIRDIVNSEPYIYRKYLGDFISESKKRDELYKQHSEYFRNYEELFETLMDIID